MAAMASRLVIVGGGGHAREVIQIVKAINGVASTFELAGVLADGHWDTDLLAALGVDRIGGTDDLATSAGTYVIAIGDPGARQQIDTIATGAQATAATLVHPDATIGDDAQLGDGFIAFAGARLTTNVRAGRHVHVNLNATVSHDCELGDYVTLSPGAALAGKVRVGSGAFFGVNASVLPGVEIGAGATVGAGAVVTADVAPGVTVAGIPAKAITSP
jgi:sugar O-acyltransferase (sialic acid O-acetyltransferase NeuD family)